MFTNSCIIIIVIMLIIIIIIVVIVIVIVIGRANADKLVGVVWGGVGSDGVGWVPVRPTPGCPASWLLSWLKVSNYQKP
jgi:hypothetical protein